MNRVRVIGVGNPLLGDDGLGIAAIEQLQLLQLPEEVELIDGGCGGLNLVHLFAGCRRVVLIDAADFGGQPGESRQLAATDLPRLNRDLPRRLGHHFALPELLAVVHQQAAAPLIELFLMQAADCRPNLHLSPAVAEQLPAFVAQISTCLTRNAR